MISTLTRQKNYMFNKIRIYKFFSQRIWHGIAGIDEWENTGRRVKDLYQGFRQE